MKQIVLFALVCTLFTLVNCHLHRYRNLQDNEGFSGLSQPSNWLSMENGPVALLRRHLANKLKYTAEKLDKVAKRLNSHHNRQPFYNEVVPVETPSYIDLNSNDPKRPVVNSEPLPENHVPVIPVSPFSDPSVEIKPETSSATANANYAVPPMESNLEMNENSPAELNSDENSYGLIDNHWISRRRKREASYLDVGPRDVSFTNNPDLNNRINFEISSIKRGYENSINLLKNQLSYHRSNQNNDENGISVLLEHILEAQRRFALIESYVITQLRSNLDAIAEAELLSYFDQVIKIEKERNDSIQNRFGRISSVPEFQNDSPSDQPNENDANPEKLVEKPSIYIVAKYRPFQPNKNDYDLNLDKTKEEKNQIFRPAYDSKFKSSLNEENDVNFAEP